MPDSNVPLTHAGRQYAPEEIAGHAFPSARKGLDPEAVRRFLAEISVQVRDLNAERAELRSAVSAPRPAAVPSKPSTEIPDEAVLTTLLGEEMTRVLQTARESASAIVVKAERQAAELLASAEAIVESQRAESETDVKALRTRASEETAELIEKTKAQCREMIEEAREVRRKILSDLSDRRRVFLGQLDQIRAGKESLVATVESVAASMVEAIDDVRSQLRVAEEPAGMAVEHAARGADDSAVERDDIEVLVEKTLAMIPTNGAAETGSSRQLSDGGVAEMRVFDIEREPRTRNAEDVAARPSRNAPIQSRSSRTPDLTPTTSQLPKTSEPVEPTAPTEPIVVTHPVAPDTAEVNVVIESAEAPQDASPVDELFAKIRASRESKTNDAQRVLEDQGLASARRSAPARRRGRHLAADIDVDDALTASPGSTPAADDQAPHPVAVATASSTEESASHDAVDPATEDTPKQRRDGVLEPVHLDVSRAMKRTLREEQNLLLDALRNQRKGEPLHTLIPGDATRERLVQSISPGVEAAYTAGHKFLVEGSESRTKESGDGAEANRIAIRVADNVLEALSARLEPAFSGASVEVQDASEAVGAAFRDWKAARVESLCFDAVIEAFAAGEIAYGRANRVSLSWILDDAGADCSDCDDNGMAGPVEAGKPFPTGHLHPPVHSGCRCFLGR